MSTSDDLAPGVRRPADPRGGHAASGRWPLVAWGIVGTLLLTVVAVYALIRWPGAYPIGSDNDEYLLVAQALARLEPPLVAGVEGTKYPVGYPALLALLSWLRLPVEGVALALNVASLAATVAVVAWIAGRATRALPASPPAALAAGAVVATSVAVWNDVYSVMPEILLLGVVAGLLAAVDGPVRSRRLAIVGAIGVVAVLLKSLALLLVVGGLGGLWLALRRRPRLLRSGQDAHDRDDERSATVAGDRRATQQAPACRPTPSPPAATVAGDRGVTQLLHPGPILRPSVALVAAIPALLTVLAGMLWMRRYPEHTTGYLASFRLADPNDASQGELGVGGLIVRTASDIPATLADLGRAAGLADAGLWAAAVFALLALGLGMVGASRLRPRSMLGPFVTGMTLAYALGMTVWPYQAARFGIPLVPVAALGAAWLVRLLGGRSSLRAVLTGLMVAVVLVAVSFPGVSQRAASAEAQLARDHAALATLEDWAEGRLEPGQVIVSFDYREVARRLERPVAPIGYTSDPEALWEQVAHADWLVAMELYFQRRSQVRTLVTAYPDRFEPVLQEDGMTVWRIVHPEG